MAKQTFTTGQVLTAAQMTSLQQTAMGGGSATAKTTSYVLVAADAGTTVAMNAAGSTTITVNTGLFSAGDTVFIQNWGAGTCTITAGTATVSTHGSLALSQYEGGQLYFTSSSAAIFFDVSQSTGMTNPMTTTGDIIYSSSGSTPARLGIGSSGQVLGISAGVPAWTTASSGSYTSLASGNSSTSSSTLVLSGIVSGYQDLVFVAYDFYPSISARTMAITANSVTDYDYAIQTLLSGTSITSYGGVAAASIDPQYNSMDNVNDENALRFTIFNYTDTSAYKLVNFTHHFRDRLGNFNSLFGWGTINTTSAITSLTINVNANFGAASPYTLYGVK